MRKQVMAYATHPPISKETARHEDENVRGRILVRPSGAP